MDENMNNQGKKVMDKYMVPLSILAAGILIGGGIYLNGRIEKVAPTPVQEQKAKSENLGNVLRPIDVNDHMLGSDKARLVVVEYSDTECPFCKNFHSSMLEIMKEYGSKGDVAWVYRHFPIEQLHSKATKEAEALECAGVQGGNGKFWEYTNKIYEVTTSNDTLDLALLPKIAAEIGLDSSKFSTCLASGELLPRVNLDIQNARELGALGTPYSVIIDTKTNQFYPIEGAYPYPQLKQAIDLILQS